LRSANRNGLREAGEKLMDMKRYQDAIDMLKFNVKVNPLYYVDYNLLARAWLLSGNKEEAIKNFLTSTTLYDDREENEAFKELKKLDVTR
jgi:tetratricopeptide (TPR) repeat protein